MGAPQGYTALGLVGYTDKGTYLASATYNRYNVVLYNGSSYVAIKDGITGVTPSNDGVNWRLFANGFPENGISTDNFQDTLKQYIANNGTTNQEGFALDARQGNYSLEGTLASRVKENEDAISSLNSGSTFEPLKEPTEYLSNISEYDKTVFMRNGQVITLTICMKALKDLTAYQSYLTLPEEYRPNYTLFVPEIAGNGIRIGTNGSFMLTKNISANEGIETVVSYIK